eukprot:925187-Pelagomonas_calceolata.AAC.7
MSILQTSSNKRVEGIRSCVVDVPLDLLVNFMPILQSMPTNLLPQGAKRKGKKFRPAKRPRALRKGSLFSNLAWVS